MEQEYIFDSEAISEATVRFFDTYAFSDVLLAINVSLIGVATRLTQIIGDELGHGSPSDASVSNESREKLNGGLRDALLFIDRANWYIDAIYAADTPDDAAALITPPLFEAVFDDDMDGAEGIRESVEDAAYIWALANSMMEIIAVDREAMVGMVEKYWSDISSVISEDRSDDDSEIDSELFKAAGDAAEIGNDEEQRFVTRTVAKAKGSSGSSVAAILIAAGAFYVLSKSKKTKRR